MSIGSRIKEKREELGITQTELAKIVGVSKGSIGNYESGVSAPNEKILFKLFKALKCDANFLYQDDMKAFSKENEFSVSSNEKAMIKKYRSLDTYGKELIDKALDVEYRRCESQNSMNTYNHSDTITIAEVARTNDNRKSLTERQVTAKELEIFDIAPQSDEEL